MERLVLERYWVGYCLMPVGVFSIWDPLPLGFYSSPGFPQCWSGQRARTVLRLSHLAGSWLCNPALVYRSHHRYWLSYFLSNCNKSKDSLIHFWTLGLSDYCFRISSLIWNGEMCMMEFLSERQKPPCRMLHSWYLWHSMNKKKAFPLSFQTTYHSSFLS